MRGPAVVSGDDGDVRRLQPLRPLLDLEGLKAWREGRTSGYQQLERAVEEVGFYDDAGNVFVTLSEEEARAEARERHGRDVPLRRDEDVLDTWF